MELCKSCGKVLIEIGGEFKHQFIANCKNVMVADLIGIHFMDGYFEFEVMKRHSNEGQFYCDGRGSNNLKKRVYEKSFIIKNAIS